MEEAWGGAEDCVPFHSAARWWACRRGLCLQIRARRWDRGLGGGQGGVVEWRVWGKGADLGIPAARQFTMCNTCLSAPTVPLCKAPFTIKMTEQFISCAAMIDMSYLWELCLSSTGVWALFFLSADSAHGTFRHFSPDSDLACRQYQRGDLSHAIMAEHNGDEVCGTKTAQDQRAGIKAD